MISLHPEHYKVRIRRSKRLRYRILRALLQPARSSRHAVSRPRRLDKRGPNARGLAAPRPDGGADTAVQDSLVRTGPNWESSNDP
jgi:hypothetical protein